MASTDVALKKENYQTVKGLIEQIATNRNAEPFLEPVPWEGKSSLLLTLRAIILRLNLFF